MLQRGGAWTTDLATLNETRGALGLPAVHSGLSAWEAPELVLVTAPGWLDLDLDYPPHVVHAGPLGIRTTGERGELRHRQVLLSFSTTAMEGQMDLVQRVCDAIAMSDVQATLTVGPAVDLAALDSPDNVKVVAFGDHEDLLSRCAGVVGHGGLGTTLRALAHGVPLVMLPLGRDQHFNAARVAELGAGISLDADSGPPAIHTAIEAMLTEPSFSAAARGVRARIVAAEPDLRAATSLERLTAERITLAAKG